MPPPRIAPRAPGTGLRGLLRTIDGGPFHSYRRILGAHELGDFRLTVLSVPPDALGGPARVRLSIDRLSAGLLADWSRGEVARLVLEDEIIRAAARALDDLNGPSPASAPGSGRLWIEPPGPELTSRTSAAVDDERLELALAFDLPAAERRVRGQQAESILFDHLPRVGMAALLFPLRRVDELKPRIVDVARRRAASSLLSGRGLAALVPHSALSGRTIAPGASATVETSSGPVAGLAIPTGITLVVTGGVRSAGAWLRSVVAASGAPPGATALLACPVATVSASRRAFGPLDLSAFVRPCPDVPAPQAYATQAAPALLAVSASLVEAFEAGARIVVLDEDETPTGAFVSDGRLEALLGETPSLVPTVQRFAELRDRWGLSFLIAARAAGSLCDLADTVLVLRDDRVDDVTEKLRGTRRTTAAPKAGSALPPAALPAGRSMRVVIEEDPKRLKVGVWGGRGVRVGEDLVDLADTTLLGDAARLRAVAALLKRAALEASTFRPVEDVLDALEHATERPVFDRLEEPGLVDLSRPSRIEIAQALVRWKRVTFRVAAVRLRPSSEDPQ